MLQRPKFKSHFRIEVVEPDLLFLLTETDSQVIQSRLHVLLAPLLDGQNDLAAINKRLARKASPLDIQYGLESLEARGYLMETNGARSTARGVFCDALGISPDTLRKRLKSQAVTIATAGNAPREPFVKILKSLRIAVRRNAGFLVVLVDDYLRPELGGHNRRALDAQRPWMVVKPTGTQLWIGPIFRPGETGCWACLAKRLREHRQAAAFLQGHRSRAVGVRTRRSGALPSTLQTALNLAATEVWKWMAQGENEGLSGKIVTLRLKPLEWETHAVVRQPRCPECGENPAGGRGGEAPVILEARRKEFCWDGGFRSEAPEETYRRYGHHVSPITGIVAKLEPRRVEDGGLIHVYAADHSFPQIRATRRFLADGGQRRSAGKGMTAGQARVSALCEALERYSGVFQGDEPRRTARLQDLGASAIHPQACLNFSARQYREREEWNARGSRYNWVPAPFDEEREIEWTAAWSLTGECVKYVPTAYCYYAYPASEEHDFCRADSNGNAAGQSLEEAILQGFLELVERDAVALWWYNQARRPGVDLESFEQSYFRRLRDYYRSIERSVHVLDITSDIGIPAFVAVSLTRDSAGRGLLLGFGAHLDAGVAIGRALTEMNQFLPQIRLGKQRLAFENDLREISFLVPEPGLGERGARDYRQPGHQRGGEDLREDVKRCVALAEERGLETVVVDQTRPDVGLRVVKVIVPGLRQFWARFAPGRLYDVPVRLGWLPQPREEADLNPAQLST